VEFEVVRPQVEELREGEPRAVVLENARRKARAGLELAEAGEGTTVLGADTDVAIDGRLLGKPEDADGARRRLETLSGRTHEVLGAIVLLEAGEGGSERSGVAGSEVTCAALDPSTIDLYVRSGEWRDRAGAYAIQGLGSILVEELRGDFSNVVGLSVALLLQLEPKLLD
jgi:septum formation protein